jgi:hypothetical protein
MMGATSTTRPATRLPGTVARLDPIGQAMRSPFGGCIRARIAAKKAWIWLPGGTVSLIGAMS